MGCGEQAALDDVRNSLENPGTSAYVTFGQRVLESALR
jgi:hypothetical protein